MKRIFLALKICKYSTIKLYKIISLNGKTSQRATITATAVCSMLIACLQDVTDVRRIYLLLTKPEVCMGES